MINIRRDINDKFYRYKMPILISKIEGKGNGIKTVIPNMSDIAKALYRPVMYPTKYFGCELGSQVKGDAASDRYILNGAHDAEKLQTILDGFIVKFVLCGSCKNPETDLIISKDEFITKNCKACGAITPVEMTHKIIPFIIKNPPKPSKTIKSKKDKKLKKNAINQDTASVGSNDDEKEDSGDDEITKKINAEAAFVPEAEDGNDDDWVVDTSADAVAARMKELSVQGAVAKLLDDNDDILYEDPLDTFGNFVSGHSDQEIIEKGEELEIRRDKIATILAQTLFDSSILTQIPARQKVLKHFIKSEKEQKGFLGGLERLVGMAEVSLLPKIPHILKAFFDMDLLDEEVLLAWGDKASKKYVDKKISKSIREKAAPFLNWLKDAEEESSEED